MICHNLHDQVFEDFFVTACQERFELMCGISDHDKIHDTTSYFIRYSCVWPIPIDVTTDVLKSLGDTIYFIDAYL